jgi:hypothetical protein
MNSSACLLARKPSKANIESLLFAAFHALNKQTNDAVRQLSKQTCTLVLYRANLTIRCLDQPNLVEDRELLSRGGAAARGLSTLRLKLSEASRQTLHTCPFFSLPSSVALHFRHFFSLTVFSSRFSISKDALPFKARGLPF